jgi:uncharacterized protein (DUF1697 family)
MHQYISILRGINVSGQKKIKMADLKALYQTLGFTDVTTYIQSGNVIFSSVIADKAQIKSILEQAIEKHYEFQVPIEIRTAAEFSQVLSALPFQDIEPERDGTQVMFTFLSAVPDESYVTAIQTYVVEPEKLVVDGQTVYLHCPNGYGKSKLSNVFIEKKLKVVATTRNLKSVIKLCELAG